MVVDCGFPGGRSEKFPVVDTVRATLSRPVGVGKLPVIVILHGGVVRFTSDAEMAADSRAKVAAVFAENLR